MTSLRTSAWEARGVPDFLGGVPGFLEGVHDFWEGVPGFLGGVPGCSGVPCSGVPASTTCHTFVQRNSRFSCMI